MTIRNMDKLEAAFRRAPSTMAKELTEALNESRQKIERDAKSNAPVNKSFGGGNLRQSIRSRMEAFGRAVVEAGASYASHVEFGTKPHTIRSRGNYPLRDKRTGQVFGRVVNHPGTKAQPFMRPAVSDNENWVNDRFQGAVEKVFGHFNF